MQLRDKRCCWRLKKSSFCSKSCRFGPLKLRFRFSPRPAVELYALSSLCLACWAGSDRLDSAWFQIRFRRQVVRKSIFRLERAQPCWGIVVGHQWPGELEMECRQLYTLCGFTLCTYSSWWLLFRTPFGKFFSMSQTFWFVFRDQWSNTLRQGKVVISKSVSFSDKRHSGRMA